MSTDSSRTVVGIESIEHASAVLKVLRSSSSSQRTYQTLADGHVFKGVDDFNHTVMRSAQQLTEKKLNTNARFGGHGGYSENEIIRTRFKSNHDQGDLSGFDYDSFGDRSPEKSVKSETSLNDLRVSAEFKKMLTSSVYGEGPGGVKKVPERDEFGIRENDDEEDDPYASGKLGSLTQDESFDFDSDQYSPSRSKYDKEKSSPTRSLMSSTTGARTSKDAKLSKPAMAIAASRTADSRIMMNKDAIVKKTGVFVRPSGSRIRKGKTTSS